MPLFPVGTAKRSVTGSLFKSSEQPSRLCRREFRPVAKILLRSAIRFRCAALLVVRTQFIAVGPSSQSLSHQLDHGAPQDHGQSEQREHEEERNQQRSPQAAGSSHPDRRHFRSLSTNRRARAASLRSSGSLLARASRKGSLVERASASSSGSGRRPHGPPGGHEVYRLRDGAEAGARGNGRSRRRCRTTRASRRRRCRRTALRNTELRSALRTRGGIQPATRCVVRAVITDLGLVAGLALAGSRLCGSAGRATQNDTAHV